ncbi:MAG: hypothetical protein RIT81_19685 [Deltaproteobacteria bacterium]
MRRGALTFVLAAFGCGGGEDRVRVEFDPPPDFDKGTQVLTLRAPTNTEHYVVEPGDSVQLATQLSELDDADLEARLFSATPTELFLRPGPLAEGEVRLPPADAAWSARIEDGAVSAWAPGADAAPAFAFSCPSYVVERVDVELNDLIVGMAADADGAVRVADRFTLHRLLDGTLQTIDTSTSPLSRFVDSFVGFDDGRVSRLDDPQRLTVGATMHLGAQVVDIAASSDGTTAYAITEDGALGRYAEGAWAPLGATEAPSGRYRLTWSSQGVLVTSERDRVERWRGTERSVEPVSEDLGAGVKVMNAVAFRERTFLLAVDKDAIRYLLEHDEGAWQLVLTFESVLRDIDHAIAHPRGVLYGGADGRHGFIEPNSATECSAMRLSRGDIEGMRFLPPNTVLYDVASAELWTAELRVR